MMTKEERKAHFKRVKAQGKTLDMFSYPYRICNDLVKWFTEVLPENTKFVFDEPCDGCGSYDIYAIANVRGVIMAEFVLNYNKSRGIDKHTLSTKGTESVHGMLTAAKRYEHGDGIMEQHPEYANNTFSIVV